MAIKTFKVCASASILALATLYNSFAGSFTTAKNKYDFVVEYTGTLKDNSKGSSNKVYAQGIEINNEFGLTNNQSVALDLFFDKSDSLNDEQTESLKFTSPWKHGVQARHKVNFAYNDSISFGLQNAFFISEVLDNKKSEAYSKRWELRGMARHDAKSGFYKHSRAELSYRRNFKFDTPDVLRLDLRTKFRLAEKIDFLVQVQTYFLLASEGYIKNNSVVVQDKRINHYSFSTLKTSEVVLFTGPSFVLPNKDSIYVKFAMQLDSSSDNRKHAKSLIVGYERTMDL